MYRTRKTSFPLGAWRPICVIASFAIAGCGEPPAADDATVSNAVESAAADLDGGMPGGSTGKLWVTSERLPRHTCPSERCGNVGQLFFREAVTVLERKGDWARITKPYFASCAGGRSEYVDKGNAACVAQNGIVDGKFAEWVIAKHLSATRPPDPAETAAEDERLVAQSDDFTKYRRAFVQAAKSLIAEGRCTAGDFEENGGWMKSTNQADEPVYFMYCGGFTAANRIYLDAESGRIFT